jgi:pyruvate formate lyase activating enzyme
MNALIFDIKKYAVNDGPGIRTTVFFKGCPLRCIWCHNPESRNTGTEQMHFIRHFDGKKYEKMETVGKLLTVENVFTEVLKDEVFYQESGGGVTFSGGEPTFHADFLIALAGMLKQRGIHTALDTCGYAPLEVFEKLNPFIDLYLYDLKLIDDDLHRSYTGCSNLRIIKNLNYLSKENAEIIIRIPVIPGITDSDENFNAIAQLLDSLPNKVKSISLLPFHTTAGHKYTRLESENPMQGFKNMSRDEVSKYINIFESKGYTVTIGG